MKQLTPENTHSDSRLPHVDPSLRGLEREVTRPRVSALDLVLGSVEFRCPIADRAVRMVRGSGR